MKQLRAPSDNLLKKNTTFKWSTNDQTVFERVKEVLSSKLSLTHFDQNLDIIVAADASDYGIGAVILHKYPNGAQKKTMDKLKGRISLILP
uniref:RT_RNaseH_2 domain-containing protein n=1 Tax=Heterorhabditis bacteriophora TaxID=37862 RepID=A0A1I7WFN4_HETBA